MRKGGATIPRDGMRATCPEFKSRADHGGACYILCKRRGLKFDSYDDRNEYYALYCCGSASAQMLCRERRK